jgi:hypothetical protein
MALLLFQTPPVLFNAQKMARCRAFAISSHATGRFQSGTSGGSDGSGGSETGAARVQLGSSSGSAGWRAYFGRVSGQVAAPAD